MKAGEHETVNRLLAAYLDKEVSADEHTLVEAHLLTCGRCRRDLDSLQRAQEKLRAALRSAAAEANPSTEAWKELEMWIGGAQRPSFTRGLANLIVRRKQGRKKPGPGKQAES